MEVRVASLKKYGPWESNLLSGVALVLGTQTDGVGDTVHFINRIWICLSTLATNDTGHINGRL